MNLIASKWVVLISIIVLLLSGYRLFAYVCNQGIEVTRTTDRCLSLNLEQLNRVHSTDYPAPKILIAGQSNCQSFAVEYFPVLPWGLDLNEAGVHLLTIVKGIGPKTAGQIVNERERNGSYRTMDDFWKRTGLRRDLFRESGDWVYVGE